MKKLFNVQAWQLSVAIYLPLIPSLGQQIQNCVWLMTPDCCLIISGHSSGYCLQLILECMQFLKLVLLVIQTNDCDCLYLKSSCHLKCLQENVLIIFNYSNLTVPQSRPFKLRQLNWLCEIFLCKYFLTSFMWIINIKGMVSAAQNMLIWTFTCLCVEFVHQFNWSWVPAKAKFVWNQQPTHNQ